MLAVQLHTQSRRITLLIFPVISTMHNDMQTHIPQPTTNKIPVSVCRSLLLEVLAVYILAFFSRVSMQSMQTRDIVMNIFISPKLIVQYIHDKARTKVT